MGRLFLQPFRNVASVVAERDAARKVRGNLVARKLLKGCATLERDIIDGDPSPTHARRPSAVGPNPRLHYQKLGHPYTHAYSLGNLRGSQNGRRTHPVS